GRLTKDDFTQLEQALLSLAQHHFRSLIATDWPYPDSTEAAWAKACGVKGVEVDFTDEISAIVSCYLCYLRGEVKTKCRTLVPILFQLYDATQKPEPQEMRDKVAKLLQGNSFVFKAVINETWYANRSDEGVMCAEYFVSKVSMERRGVRAQRGIPIMTIALVLTVVQCVLEEWITGQRCDIQFTETAYSEKFDQQLTALERFEANTKDLDIVSRIRVNLLSRARTYAKVPETGGAEVEMFVQDDYEAARREWELNGAEYDSE
ncbi:hypothetical protein NEOLEDRAFT_1072243, partial [Neolentinus lepideus HHB14362 ss-1]